MNAPQALIKWLGLDLRSNRGVTISYFFRYLDRDVLRQAQVHTITLCSVTTFRDKRVHGKNQTIKNNTIELFKIGWNV